MSFIYSTSLVTPELLIREVPKALDVEVGDIVRIGIGEVVKAQANNISNSNVLGVVESTNGDFCNIRTMGITGFIFTTLTSGVDYYLSDTQPGKLTTVAPTNSGTVVLKLGQALDSERLLVFKSTPLVRS